MSDFYILSLKWSPYGYHLNWWGPNNIGYTIDIDRAGKYTREQVDANPSYYNDGQSTLAIPCGAVESVTHRTVLDGYFHELRKLAPPTSPRRSA